MAYYAYLPALLIYDDPTYSFVDENIDKYYFEGAKKSFLVEVENGGKINKTYPGAALLYLPFFLIAHFLAMLFGDPDGFSIWYQMLFEIGHFFYVFLGLGFMLKIFELKGVSGKTSLLSTIILVLGTNLFYYIEFDLSLVHIHSMALINATVFLILKWERSSYRIRWATPLSAFTIALAVITRPTDVLAVLVVLIFLENRLNTIKEIFINQWKKLPVLVLITLAVLMVPSLLWEWQAGISYAYSYGEEGFDFTHPEVLNFLFSYNNGWLLYSPLLLLVLPLGLGLLWIRDKLTFTWTIVFYILSIFIFSSWWCWYYGCSFGQRTMVDYYIIVGYLLALILSSLNNFAQKIVTLIMVSFLLFLNVLQSYQRFNGYMVCSGITSEMYWDNFLQFKKQAKVYLASEEKVIGTKKFPLDTVDSETGGILQSNNEAISNGTITITSKDYSFSATVRTDFHTSYEGKYLIISCYVQQKGDIEKTNLVVEQPGVEDSYQRYGLVDYAVKDKWVKMEFKYYLRDPKSPIVVYFWNEGSNENNWFDEMEIKVIK